MKTTELFADIVIIGFLALLWISGFAFSYILDAKLAKTFLTESSGNALIFILVASYTLGIIFDYINSTIFSCFKSKAELKLYEDMSIVKVLHKNEKMYALIENYYGRMRILRSIIISIPLLILSLSCFVSKHSSYLQISLNHALFVIILTGIVIFILSILSYRARNKDYKRYIRDLKELYLPKT